MTVNKREVTPSLLLEGIKENFGVSYDQYDKQYLKFFDQETSTKDVEKYQEIGGFGLHQKKNEAQDTSLDQYNEGHATYIENIAYALGYQISHEAVADNLYPKILSKALDLGVSAAQTVETIVTDRLNTAFSEEKEDLLANGQPMCSVNQPLSGTSNQIIQNRPNIGASLSEASLIIDMNNIAKFKDPKGKKIFVRAEMLIVPQGKDVVAQKLLDTNLQVGSNNNDINPFGRSRGRLPKGYVISQFLTNDNAYFIRTNVRGLVFQKREMPAKIMDDLVIRSMVKEVISYMRFGVGCYDFRSIYGNPGS